MNKIAGAARFPTMLIAWRTRNQPSRAAAARTLWCSAGTVGLWERGQSLPQGARNPRLWAAMVATAVLLSLSVSSAVITPPARPKPWPVAPVCFTRASAQARSS